MGADEEPRDTVRIPPLTIVGLSLSGPSTTMETAMAIGHAETGGLTIEDCRVGMSDAAILALARRLSGTPCIYAVGAPLSYNDGGGDRPSDEQLRHEVVRHGLSSGTVVSPTTGGMTDLTLRGLALSRGLRSVVGDSARLVEVHPRGAMLLRGAPKDAVRDYGSDPAARLALLGWLPTQGLRGLPMSTAMTRHTIAAVGATLAGWAWSAGHSAWCWKAAPPLHPFDLAC